MSNRLRGIHSVTYVKKENGLMYPVEGGLIHMADQEENKVVPVVQPEPVASPTGQAIIPPKVVPWLVILAVLASTVAGLPAFGVAIPPAVVTVASVIGGLLAALGIASPGLRKPNS